MTRRRLAATPALTSAVRGGVGAVLAESQVVLGRSAIVAVAADDDLDGGMRVEVGGGLRDGGLGVGAEVVAVVVEEDVLDVLVEDGVAAHVAVLVAGRGGRFGHADGDANVGFGGAAVALRGEVEVGRVGGRDGLGAVGVDLADAVDGDGGGVLRAPVEDDGLAEIDGGGIGGDGGGGRGAGRGRRGPEAVRIDAAVSSCGSR